MTGNVNSKSSSTSSSNGHTTIGEFLRSLRERSGRTLGSVGDEIGITGTHVGCMERGTHDPSPKYLKGLAKAYYQSDIDGGSSKALYLRMLVIAGYITDADLAITPTTNRRQQLEEQLTAAKGVVAGLEAKLRAYDVLFGTASGGILEATQQEGG